MRLSFSFPLVWNITSANWKLVTQKGLPGEAIQFLASAVLISASTTDFITPQLEKKRTRLAVKGSWGSRARDGAPGKSQV
jgi:hypothetical protein